jgi:hypothetical protein
MGFTPMQHRLLRKSGGLLDRAWMAHCRATGEPPNHRGLFDRFYRDVLWTLFHVHTSKALNAVLDFDTLMSRLAVIAGDDKEIGYWSAAALRRFVHLVRTRLREITRLTGTPHDWNYARGIMNQMHLPEQMEDVPPELMRNVFIAMDRHVIQLRDEMGMRQDPERSSTVHVAASDLPF